MVRAFGCTHVPISPGVHTKTVRMFMPVEKNNKCNEFFGIFKSTEGMVIDSPDMIAKAYGRDVARVGAGGTVTV